MRVNKEEKEKPRKWNAISPGKSPEIMGITRLEYPGMTE